MIDIEEIANELTNKLHEVANAIKEKTGADVILCYGIDSDGILHEGAVGTKDLEYKTASMLLVGMTSIVADYYGNKKD